jgi:DNA-binding transcriptional ArsR family regulator
MKVRMLPPSSRNSTDRPWRLLSAHGLVLFYISVRPDCTATEISEALSLTMRSVWGTLGNLRRADMIEVRKEGRRNRYRVNYGANVGISVLPDGVELRTVLRFLASRTLKILDDEIEGGVDATGDEMLAKVVTRL